LEEENDFFVILDVINIGTVNWLSFYIIFTFKKLNDIKIRGKA